MKMKSVFTITVIALLPIAALAQTPAAPAQPPQPPHPPHPPGMPPGMPGHHEKGPKVPITYLGVDTSQVPTVVSDQLGLAKGFGLVVDYVEPNSPAATAGVQQSDILKMLNDQILIEPSQLRKLLQTFPEGTEVTLTVLRKGQEQKLTAKLAKKEMQQRRSAFPGGNHDWHWDFDATGDLKEQMQDLKEQLKEQLGDQRGIIRDAVTQAHEAARRARDDARRAADQLRIFFEDDGAVNASKIDLGKAQIVLSDEKGQLKLANVDGRKLLTVKDPHGKLVFSGPVETKEDLDKLPADVRDRYNRLEQNDLPTVAPRSDTDSGDEIDTDDADDEDDDDDEEAGEVSQQVSFQSSDRDTIPQPISF